MSTYLPQRGAQGKADADLLLSRRAARHQHVGYIGARYQENQCEDQHRRRNACAETRIVGIAEKGRVLQRDGKCAVFPHVGGGELTYQCIRLGLRLLCGNAEVEPRQDLELKIGRLVQPVLAGHELLLH